MGTGSENGLPKTIPTASGYKRKPAQLQGFEAWARLDSNQGPTDYESAALTN
jgi:hypothetical protein